MTTPLSVVQLASGTFHVCAAAVMSIDRAAAPDSRSTFHMPRTLLLPAVSCCPPKFGLPYFGSAPAHSVLIFFQSKSSSSATSIGIDVITPCPISSIVSMMRTLSSALTRIQMFGSNVPAAPSAVEGPPSGRYVPIMQPPPAAVAVLRKVRRERLADRVMCRLLYTRAARRIER